MQELAWLAEILRMWLEGATWADIQAAPGFRALLLLAACLAPSSLILVGICGWTDWRETPLAAWFGFARRDPNDDWAEMARDLDKDGTADF